MRRQYLHQLFPYYGAKYRAVHHYPPPQYDTVREPFAGAAGYGLRYFTRKVVLYDTCPEVAGTWDYLIRVREAELMSLPLVFEDARDLKIPQEAKWLIGWWLAMGDPRPVYRFKKRTDWHRDTGRKYGYWTKWVRCRIAAQLKHTRHWKVYCKSYEDVGDHRCTWFVDPPYNNKAGSYYLASCRGIDYAHLAQWCYGRRGQTIVCENAGADWLPFVPLASVKAMSNKGGVLKGRVSREVVYHQTDRQTGFGLLPKTV